MRDGRTCRRIAWVAFTGVAVVAAVAVTVVLVLAYGHAKRPTFDVGDVSLARFSLSTSAGGPTSISYNLTLRVTVHNPNWAMGATFHSLEADYLFDGQRFGRAIAVAVPAAPAPGAGFVLRAREAAAFVLASGAEEVNLMNGNASVETYRNQSETGAFDVLVGFCGQVTYRLHSTWCRLEVNCGQFRLKLGEHGGGKNATCEVHSSQSGC